MKKDSINPHSLRTLLAEILIYFRRKEVGKVFPTRAFRDLNSECAHEELLNKLFEYANYLKMPILDAIMAATFTSAKSLQLENEVGSIEIGKKADILVWNIERTVQIPFLISDHSIQSIIKNGSIVS